jgi:hypothetical protein
MEGRIVHILLDRLQQSKSFAAQQITVGVCREALLQKWGMC